MRLAVFEGDVCASIEKDLVARNIQVARRFPAMMRFPRHTRDRPAKAMLLFFICEHKVS